MVSQDYTSGGLPRSNGNVAWVISKYCEVLQRAQTPFRLGRNNSFQLQQETSSNVQRSWMRAVLNMAARLYLNKQCAHKHCSF